MAKYLVIVESPAKVKTIKKFLGKNYEVMASNGHVRDLPKSQLGIDVDNDYEPKYITIRGKGDILSGLRKEVKKADKIYLATDPDREGEAISWHLYHALKLEGKECSRISFNEITKNAVKESLKHAGEINMDLVDAQQARRVLDRIVGYKISPILWAKVKRGLSAGRVQSVALKIICDREEEINAFIPKEYWTLDALIDIKGEKKPITAKFYGDKNGKLEISSKEDMLKIKNAVEKSKFSVDEVKRGTRTKNPPNPFITSTLQQEASKQLNYSTQKTMRIAQQLYEDGLISYLRTDSVRISEEAKGAAAEYILKEYGKEFLGADSAKKSNGKAQDAHEAIRPTDINRLPSDLKDKLSRDNFRLYQLIWKRFTASQMAAAKYDTTSVKISAGDYIFTVSASSISFKGFMSVYSEEDETSKDSNLLSSSIDEKSSLELNSLNEEQHFTQPPAHFTEASLVKALEELGIGRPSTYAPTITTILARRYITKENKNLFVSEIGEVVNKIMKESFPDIINQNFTAKMEEQLDEVESGDMEWKNIVREFYPPFEKELEIAEKELEKVEIHDEVTDEICESCGRNMVIKYGPHGKFLACPGFPECRNTKPYLEKAGVKCPKCGKEVIIRRTKKGRRYFGCEGYPECDFVSWQKPSEEKCPQCGGYMVEKGNKLACADNNCGFVKTNKALQSE
ncbi:MAG: type I DNA topoisomerase [Eubacterium sp.]|nr:type I DNA topoisomerase [Eubacterium sp.]